MAKNAPLWKKGYPAVSFSKCLFGKEEGGTKYYVFLQQSRNLVEGCSALSPHIPHVQICSGSGCRTGGVTHKINVTRSFQRQHVIPYCYLVQVLPVRLVYDGKSPLTVPDSIAGNSSCLYCTAVRSLGEEEK